MKNRLFSNSFLSLVLFLVCSNFAFSTNYTLVGTGFSMSNTTGCALSNYTFNQTTANNNSSKQSATKVVTITFPAGTDATTATVAGSTYKGTAITAFTTQTATTIAFTTPAGVNVGKNAAFTIVIANVKNGASIGGITCTVVITNDSGGTNSWTTGYNVTTTACPSVPGNDNCGTPTALTPAPSGSGTCTTTNGTTFGATASPQSVCTGQADDDVWYTFVANSTTHQVTVSGVAGFNAVVEVMSGTCAGTLTSMQCVNATGAGLVETASLTGLTIGTTYYIRVYHNGVGPGVSTANSFTICVTSTTAACTIGAGNILGVALPYSSGAQTTCGAGDDITSTNSAVCGSSLYYGGEDKVITFVPGTSGNISINLTSAGSYVGITLYQGCPTAGGTCVAYSQSSLGNQSIGCASVIAGQTYYLVVDSWPTPTCNAFSVTISAPTGGIPAGTTCSNAVSMTLPYTATGQSTLCYGNDYTNASIGSCGTLYESGEDKVYAFTTTGPDCLSLLLSNASTSYIGYQVYSGCPGTAGTTCISNGGGATSGTLTGSFTVPSAGTYYVVIDTWSSPSYVNYDIQLTSLGGTPTNDVCAGATSIPLGTSVFGDNNCTGGSGEPAVPGTWTSGNVNTIWFSLLVPASGQVLVKTTAGTLTNTQIAAYTGASCAALTFNSANNDIGSCGSTTNYMSQLSLTGLTAGSTLYIRVDGESNATGNFTITAIDPTTTSLPGVQGQDCSQPNPVCQATMSVSNPGYSGNGNVCDINTGYCLASGERNVVWYRVPIATAGNLNFNIVPNDFVSATESETDYDFAVWQTADGSGTGVLGTDYYNCTQIAAGTAPPVACNFSYLGVTGVGTGGNAPTSLSGTVCPQCGGGYNPSVTYSAAYEPTIATLAGDEYLIAISNFSNSTSGFRIEFLTGGANCVINYAAATATAEVYWSGGDATVPNEVNDVDNWGGCTSPTCAIDAYVSAVSNEPIVATGTTRSVRNLTIQPGATLTLQAGSTLEICGNYVNYGTLIASPTSTVVFKGPAAQTMSGNLVGTSKFGNLTITKLAATGVVTLLNDVEIGGTLTTSNINSILNTNGKYVSLAGNFSNFSGNTTYSNTGVTGTLEFNGSGSQTYNQGATQLDLNFVNVNNTAAIGSGVTLATNMFIKTVTGTLVFNQGTITTGALRVEVDNTAAACVTSGTTTSFVDGNLRRYLLGTGAYNWPVGNVAKGYQRARTTFSSNTNTFIDARFDVWPGGAGYPIIQGSAACGTTFSLDAMNNGYWTLTASPNTASVYDMSLFPTNVTNIASGWTVMKKPAIGPMPGWILDGSCAASTAAQVNRTGLSGFSVFGVAQSPTPLPIELTEFSGEEIGEDNLLTWTTASEHNNDYFTLERSRNGVDFEDLAIVEGAGNSTTQLNYQEFDYNPYPGINYYRLKQTDFDGQFSYSQTISLNRTLDQTIVSELFPNPANSSVNFDLTTVRKGTISVAMYDNAGRLIAQYNYEAHAGSNNYNINISDLAKGIYTLVLKSELLENTEIKQLIKN